VVSSINPNDPSVLASLQRDESSVLDLVREDAKALRNRGSMSDRVKLDEYFESLRSVELRLEAAMKPQKRWINQGKPPVERPTVAPATHQEHVRLMLDIMLLAFWTDTTRIATFMFGDAQSGQDYSWLDGVRGSFHGLSHHLNEEDKRSQYERIINWHTTQLAWFFDRVKSIDEGGSSLLDNSMIYVSAPTLKDGNRHDPENLPVLLAGRAKGTLRPGRRVRAGEKTPLCNLYLAMLQRMGIQEQSFGDSTGVLEGLS
jgi:hypothetical protein